MTTWGQDKPDVCGVCKKPAKYTVRHISRRTDKEISHWLVCDEHAEAELAMASLNLSMVDIDLVPLRAPMP